MKRLAAVLLASLITIPVFAGVVKVDFSIAELKSPGLPSIPNFTGGFTYQASSLTADPEKLLSVDLSFGQHTYSIADSYIQKEWPGTDVPFLVLSGPPGPLGPTNFTGDMDDFYLTFNPTTQNFDYFVINDKFAPGFYSVSSFEPGVTFNMSYSEVANTVPEPGSLPLFGAGIAALVAARSRKRC
jgi:hypothetical protein